MMWLHEIVHALAMKTLLEGWWSKQPHIQTCCGVYLARRIPRDRPCRTALDARFCRTGARHQCIFSSQGNFC